MTVSLDSFGKFGASMLFHLKTDSIQHVGITVQIHPMEKLSQCDRSKVSAWYVCIT